MKIQFARLLPSTSTSSTVAKRFLRFVFVIFGMACTGYVNAGKLTKELEKSVEVVVTVTMLRDTCIKQHPSEYRSISRSFVTFEKRNEKDFRQARRADGFAEVMAAFAEYYADLKTTRNQCRRLAAHLETLDAEQFMEQVRKAQNEPPTD